MSGQSVNRIEWPSSVLICPNPVVGMDASKEAFHLMDGKAILWDLVIFLPVQLNNKGWKPCVNCGSTHGIRGK
jgi:hypothetical protein